METRAAAAAACGATAEMAGGRNVAEMDRISYSPRKTTAAAAPGAPPMAGGVGWRSETLATAPVPASTQIPRPRRAAKRASASATSRPQGISITWGRIAAAGSASRVITTGGLGLFFDPGGRPLRFLDTSMLAPSPPPEPDTTSAPLLAGSLSSALPRLTPAAAAAAAAVAAALGGRHGGAGGIAAAEW
nr:unnamed protein product [Digitaria exilis]